MESSNLMSPRFTFLFLSITLSLTTAIISPTLAQTPSNAPSREEVEERIRKIETQMDAIRDWRLRNQGIAFSSIYKLTPQFTIGLEYRRLETDHLQSGRQTASHLNLGAAFSF
jgi:hypothetical protein